jgi:hypothetical protein
LIAKAFQILKFSPGTLGDNPGCKNGEEQWHGGGEAEKFPVGDEIGHPRHQNCRQGEVNGDGHVGHECTPARSDILQN